MRYLQVPPGVRIRYPWVPVQGVFVKNNPNKRLTPRQYKDPAGRFQRLTAYVGAATWRRPGADEGEGRRQSRREPVTRFRGGSAARRHRAAG
jgi:hypothetical protein